VSALVYAHAVEATTLVKIEKVLGKSVPQTEKFLDFLQFLHRISNEVLGTDEEKLIGGEVVVPPAQVYVVH